MDQPTARKAMEALPNKAFQPPREKTCAADAATLDAGEETKRSDDGASTEAAAEALKAEFYRVPSSPATRTYLNEVLRSLSQLPTPLAREALQTLADDKKLSLKWRRRFEEAAWGIEG